MNDDRPPETDGPSGEISRLDERAADARAVFERAEEVYGAEEVEAAYDRLGAEISGAVAKSIPVVMTVLNGGMVPAVRLMERFRFPYELGYLHATRYRSGLRGHDLRWVVPPSVDVAARVVVVVDDIVDEGHTLAAVLEALRKRGASKVYSAALVEKLHNRKAPGLEVDFVGLPVGDRYVFGCGMDYREFFRGLRAIYALVD